MQPTTEIEAFIERVDALPAGPGVSLDAALQPSLDDEAELRKLFATDKKNTRLSNPHVGLVDVFDAPATIRTIRARVVDGEDDLSAKYVMPVTDNRRSEGAPSTVTDLEEFKKHWAVFTEGSLSQLVNWNNVVAAGGSVLACLTPIPDADKASKRTIRTYYHSQAYPTSDVDLFLWGLTPEQAEVKIKEIYAAVRDSVPWDVTCIRTKHTVSIHSQYPYRSVQIVLRLYQSPAEILAGFDIDAPCCAYDGNRVWANPRAIVAMMRQCNTVDMTRRSPSYEVRLAKYSQRYFEVYVPTLERSKIDPTIYERSIARMEGLARLLALEKLADDNMRSTFLEGRRQLRGRTFANALAQHRRRTRRKFKGDLKGEKNSGIVEMNDYDVASLHLPYGPGWDAKRIDKLVYQTDLGMNSTFNPKNKGRRLHRHPAFFGTIEECIEDCCGNCPSAIDDDEKKLQEEEDEAYIRGRIQFIEENPGRQSMTGSFKPIDVGEWSDQVYIKPSQELFTAIAAHDRATVQRLLAAEGVDVNQRDHVGRTALHVALFSNATDIALELIDAGARITARIADGRAPLHLAAQFDQIGVIKKLLEKSAKNAVEAESKSREVKGEDAMDYQGAATRPSSEDDWSSHDDEDIVMSDVDEDDEGEDEDDNEEEDEDDEDEGRPRKKKDATTDAEEAAQEDLESDDQPDIININEFDWDFGFSALSYAVLFASVSTIKTLLAAGADLKLASKATGDKTPLHPLTLTILREDEDEACTIAECLFKAGATSSTANDNMRTIFHAAVHAGRTKLVETMLRCDPHAATVIDFPMLQDRNVTFPIVTAINKKHYGIVALLLAHDAKLELDERDISRATAAASTNVVRMLNRWGGNRVTNYVQIAYQPVEVALKNHDDLSKLLISLGASVNISILESFGNYSDVSHRRTIKEWVDVAILVLEKQIEDRRADETVVVDTPMAEPDDEEEEKGWKGFYKKQIEAQAKIKAESEWDATVTSKRRQTRINKESLEQMEDIKEFLVEIQTLLAEKGAKGWTEVYPDIETQATIEGPLRNRRRGGLFSGGGGGGQSRKTKLTESGKSSYVMLNGGPHYYDSQPVAQHLIPAYDELFEACYAGDNDKIQKLCLPHDGQSTIAGPLNISVREVDSSMGQYDQYGYTPLTVAIEGRRWSTAKVILAVATAQYHPRDKKDRIKFNLDIKLEDDDDSDNESVTSDDSDITIGQEEVNFVDIATRKSTVQSTVHPKKMLTEVEFKWILQPSTEKQKPQSITSDPLHKTIAEHNLEAFKHVVDLYQSLAKPLEINANLLNSILNHDQVEMLDEFIRRTGGGLNISLIKSNTSQQGEALPIATNDTNKVYQGLDVHGKKRMDLARKNDPDAADAGDPEKRDVPLLWQAIQAGGKHTIEYLRTDRPLAAYRAYIATAALGDEKARWLKHFLFGKKEMEGALAMADARRRLAGLLGWKINSLGESPLAAAIISDSIKMVELMERLEPDLMEKALKTNIKFVGINYLIFAVRHNCCVEVVDYLLAKNLSPLERDTHRGWNIFHYLCDQNNKKLLEHFLQKLPKDVNEELLKQQSKGQFNTPLHIAVKKGHIELVRVILEYTAAAATLLQMRDVDGQTALHSAVRTGRAETTQLLLDVAGTMPGLPSSPSSRNAPEHANATLQQDLLNTEDSVGLTPVEISRNNELAARVSGFANADAMYRYSAGTLRSGVQPDVEPRRVEVARAITDAEWRQRRRQNAFQARRHVGGRTEKGVEDVKRLLVRLEAQAQGVDGNGVGAKGRLNVGTLKVWIAEMDRLIAREKEREQKRGDELRKEEEEEEEERRNKGREWKEGDPEPVVDGEDMMRTHRVLEDIVGSKATSHRHLIHLLDVQRSVHATLVKASSEERAEDEEDEDYGRRHRRIQKHGAEGELETEDAEAEERRERRMSMVFQYIALGPDTL